MKELFDYLNEGMNPNVFSQDEKRFLKDLLKSKLEENEKLCKSIYQKIFHVDINKDKF